MEFVQTGYFKVVLSLNTRLHHESQDIILVHNLKTKCHEYGVFCISIWTVCLIIILSSYYKTVIHKTYMWFRSWYIMFKYFSFSSRYQKVTLAHPYFYEILKKYIWSEKTIKTAQNCKSDKHEKRFQKSGKI